MTTPKVCPHCGGEYDARLRFCPDDGAVLRAQVVEESLVGRVIADRYQVSKEIGAGGMGRVYEATHLRLGRRCALKVLKVALLDDVNAVARFDREAANASRITHPNVAAVYDFGDAGDGIVYLAMEFVEGEPLSAVLRREGALPPRRAHAILRQVADGLGAAHALGIVHRDLKPDNIMIGTNRDGSDCVKVVDFGIARATLGDSQKITSTGIVIGTPAYMSPEQLTGEPAECRSDIYALGLIAFELFTGVLPFPSGHDAMLARLAMPPRTLSGARKEVAWPVALEKVVRRALAATPANRYPSVEEFCAELTIALTGWSEVKSRGPARALAQHLFARKRVYGTSLGLALALVLGAVFAWNRQAEAGDTKAAAAQARPELAAVHTRSDAAGAVSEGSPVPPPDRSTRATDSQSPARVAVDSTPRRMAEVKQRPEPRQLAAVAPSVRTSGPLAAADAPPARNEPSRVRARAALDQIRQLTDPLQGTDDGARRALAQVRSLLPTLTSGADSIEAEYYAVQAHMALNDEERACEGIRRLQPRAAGHPYLANAIRGFRADSSFQCP